MKRYAYALVGAFALCLALIAYGNSNPLCYFVTRYSTEWYVLFCNWTEDPGGAEG